MSNVKMKVVHLTTVDVGGAYKAVERIYYATKGLDNIETTIMLRNKVNSNNIGEVFLNHGGNRFISKVKNLLNGIFFKSGQINADRFGCDVSENEEILKADVIVIHWINSFLSTKSISKLINLNKPIVIMLHDMWHITGGCSYAGDCKEYIDNCNACPFGRKNSNLSYWALYKKRKIFEDANVTVIGPGNWIVDCAKKSSVFRGKRIERIYNCLNVDVFTPHDKYKARTLLDINTSKPLVLFLAMTAGKKNERKGFRYLKEALSFFDSEVFEIVIIGEIDDESVANINQKKHCLGYIDNEERLSIAYSAANVTVVPSLQETFCYSACESLACGTPVVAFNEGGLIDQIVHEQNGYLAECKNSEDLANGIRFCIEYSEKMQKKARASVEKFSYGTISKEWMNLYKNLVENN